MLNVALLGALALSSASGVLAVDHAGHHWGARAAVVAESSVPTPPASSTVKASSVKPTVTAKPRVQAAVSALPLTQYTYAHDAVPYKVNPFFDDSDPEYRGPQIGYNICNGTTAGDDSMCQTLVANSIQDFCLWGAIEKDSILGDMEAAAVAWCVDGEKWGARTIPPGAITGLQFMKTPGYVQWTGHIDITKLGFAKGDTGGELDPHGADLLGNPVGGLVYSNGLPTGDNKTLQQVMEWNQFYDGDTFCLKVCDNTITDPFYCQNVYDLIGCKYNMPAAYVDGAFLECEGDVQDVVGHYTLAGGVTTTWSQPRDLDPKTTLPYTPRIPSSSNCKTYQSTEILGTATTSAAPSSQTSAAAPVASSAGASAGAVSGASAQASGPSASSKPSSGAGSLVADSGLFALVAGVAAALV